jgi:hypothetical protein
MTIEKIASKLCWATFRRKKKKSNGYAQGKNPRLHRTGATESGLRVWDVRERLTIPKEKLSSVIGKSTCEEWLTDIETQEPRKWIGKRYTRPAFPDEFNIRFDSVKKEISKIVESEEFRSVLGVYFLVTENDEELPEGKDYHLRMAFCYADNESDDPLPDAKTKIDLYIAAVKSVKGVKIIGDPLIMSEAVFPIMYLRRFIQYDYEAHSYGDPASAPPPQ